MKYDSVLYLDNDYILENDRIAGGSGLDAAYHSIQPGAPYNWDDPKLYNNFTFGRIIKRAIESTSGYFAEVSDFRKWVVVKVTYHNYENSRTASKTFLIVFKHKGDGMVMSTHNKYRTINGVDQAVSYIKSACNALQNSTQTKI